MKVKELLKNKFIKNISYIFSGTILSSLLGIINTALLVKAIGLEKNGIIFLGLSYAGFFNALFNFQSYEAIIKFIPNYLNNNKEKVEQLIQLGLIIDVGTAIFAFLFANIFLNKVSEYFNWDYQTKKYMYVLTLIILFNITGTFTGVLRIFDKFKDIAKINVYSTLVISLFYIIGLLSQLDLNYYIVITIINTLIITILMFFYSLKVLKDKNIRIFKKVSFKYEKEFFKFVLYTNLSSTLDLPIFQLTPFVINKYLGITEIAVYKILEKLGGIISRITSVISQVLMPEISNMLAKKEKSEAKKLIQKLGIIIFVIGIVGILFIKFTNFYWLKYFLPGNTEYLKSVYLYFIFIIFTNCFMGQSILFTFDGYLKYNIPILIIVNLLYLISLIFVVKKMGINGLIILRIVQAALIFSIKEVIMRIGDKNEKNTKKNNIKNI